MKNLFLGLDSSTQSLTATVIDYDTREVKYEKSINFEEEYRSTYGIKNGILSNKDELVVHAPPKMWLDAIDKLFDFMKKDGIDFYEIMAVSGSGQQHGSVYLNGNFKDYLKNMINFGSILENSDNIFSRKTSPIWMDSSTEKECAEIRKILGGVKKTVELTGSDTYARFTGPQIRKFYKQEKSSYEKTESIHLVSSFLSSIFAGVNSPIDYGDGAGMNLMDIKELKWSDKALDATAENLFSKLPDVKPSDTIVGKINKYFVKKYGFNPECLSVIWSGDNPNSLIGTGLIREGQASFSLGTSDVYYSLMRKLKFNEKGEGHIFGAPNGDYMALLVFKNGSLAREKIREQFNLSWDEFSNILAKTKTGNNGSIMLPYFFPEIIPTITKPNVKRYGFDEKNCEANVRGIIEGQILSSRIHSKWMEVNTDTIYATGGASKNKEILKIISNIHKAKVYSFNISNSASLGAALRAAYSFYKMSKQKNWEEIIDGFIHLDTANCISPNKEDMKIYDELLKSYIDKENEFLGE